MIRLHDFIICDDIRQEIGNKITIVGAYSDRIVIGASEGKVPWPISMRLGFLWRFSLSDDEKIPDVFLLRLLLNQDSLAEVTGVLNIQDPKRIVPLHFVVSNLTIPSVGSLTWALELKHQELTIGKINSPYPISVQEGVA